MYFSELYSIITISNKVYTRGSATGRICLYFLPEFSAKMILTHRKIE